MTDAATARLIAELERRVRDLERANHLQRSSVTDGLGNHVPVAPAILSAAGALANALQQRVDRAVADGSLNIFYGSSEPTGQQDGDLWYVDNTVLRKWSVTQQEWLLHVDQALSESIAAAQNTADAKTQTFWAEAAPDLNSTPVPDTGDLWFRTNGPTNGLSVPVVLDMWRWEGGWVQLPLGSITTGGYAQGTTGAKVDDNTTQFENINVVSEVGADLGTFNVLEVAGRDVNTLMNRGEGYTAYARYWGTSHSASVSTTELGLMEFNGGHLFEGRLYRFHIHGHMEGTVAGDAFEMRIRYTTDGTAVNTSSAILDGSVQRLALAHSPSEDFDLICYYAPALDYETTKFLFTLDRVVGTGTGRLYLTSIDRAFEWMVEDLGDYTEDKTQAQLVASGGTGVLSLKLKAPTAAAPTVTPPPDPDPVSSYTRSWYATWARSFDSDDGIRQGDDTNDLYQGYISGTHGNTKSLFGFDYANIQAHLAGASIKGVKITYRMKHAWAGAGIRMYLNSHDYTAEPGSWSEARVNEDRGNWGGQKAGSTYTHSLSTTIGNELKSGVTRGFGFGPAPSNSPSAYYGYAYGSGTSRPKLTITYTK